MPGTKSKLTLRQRRNKAYKLYLRGYNIGEIAHKCGVTEQTVLNYIQFFKENLREKIASDPDYFDRMVEHTFEELERLEHLEKEAWVTYEHTSQARDKVAALNLVKSVGEHRAKLKRLMDVRIEVVSRVEKSTKLQEALIQFMQTELCGKCRAKLEAYLQSAQQIEAGQKVPGGYLPAAEIYEGECEECETG